MQSSLRLFMDTSLSRQKLTVQALILLGRFDQLKIEKLNTDDKYRQLFAKFESDVDKVKDVTITVALYKPDPFFMKF